MDIPSWICFAHSIQFFDSYYLRGNSLKQVKEEMDERLILVKATSMGTYRARLEIEVAYEEKDLVKAESLACNAGEHQASSLLDQKQRGNVEGHQKRAYRQGHRKRRKRQRAYRQYSDRLLHSKLDRSR